MSAATWRLGRPGLAIIGFGLAYVVLVLLGCGAAELARSDRETGEVRFVQTALQDLAGEKFAGMRAESSKPLRISRRCPTW